MHNNDTPLPPHKLNDFSPDQEKGNIYLFFGEGGGVFVSKKLKILELEKTTGHTQTTWYTEAQQHKRC